MQGKEMLDKCPQSVRDIIIEKFGSLDQFYAYVYQIGVNQHEGYKQTKDIDTTEESNIKKFLEKQGVDYLLAGDLVSEIICDFDQVLAENYARTLLGANWKERIAAFDAMINKL